MRMLRGGARLALALVPMVLLLVYASVLVAQDPRRPEPPPERVEALARVTVGEAGWDVSRGDHAAITHLLVRRAAQLGVRPREMARRYSTSYFDPSRRARLGRRQWVAGLTLEAVGEDASAPLGWPAALPWGRYRARWGRVVAHVRGVLQGRVPDPCRGLADHWGAPSLERADLARVDCGGTLNVFWAVPRGTSEEGASASEAPGDGPGTASSGARTERTAVGRRGGRA